MSTRTSAAASTRLVARAHDLERPVDEAEHGDGEDVVGVEVAGVGGDLHVAGEERIVLRGGLRPQALQARAAHA